MRFTHHQVDLDIPQAGTLLHDLRALGTRYPTGDRSPAIAAVSPFALSSAMLEVLVKVFVLGITSVLGGPDPLVDGLLGDPGHAHGVPPTRGHGPPRTSGS